MCLDPPARDITNSTRASSHESKFTTMNQSPDLNSDDGKGSPIFIFRSPCHDCRASSRPSISQPLRQPPRHDWISGSRYTNYRPPSHPIREPFWRSFLNSDPEKSPYATCNRGFDIADRLVQDLIAKEKAVEEKRKRLQDVTTRNSHHYFGRHSKIGYTSDSTHRPIKAHTEHRFETHQITKPIELGRTRIHGKLWISESIQEGVSEPMSKIWADCTPRELRQKLRSLGLTWSCSDKDYLTEMLEACKKVYKDAFAEIIWFLGDHAEAEDFARRAVQHFNKERTTGGLKSKPDSLINSDYSDAEKELQSESQVPLDKLQTDSSKRTPCSTDEIINIRQSKRRRLDVDGSDVDIGRQNKKHKISSESCRIDSDTMQEKKLGQIPQVVETNLASETSDVEEDISKSRKYKQSCRFRFGKERSLNSAQFGIRNLRNRVIRNKSSTSFGRHILRCSTANMNPSPSGKQSLYTTTNEESLDSDDDWLVPDENEIKPRRRRILKRDIARVIKGI